LPLVPPFPEQVEPWTLLRRMPVSPKKEEDNYEVSERASDSDNEEEDEPERSEKHVPLWCKTYLEAVAAQTSIDPESIFGSRVPKCDLDLVFDDSSYAAVEFDRPARRRGSSGRWDADSLKPTEVRDYKQKMGHTRPWNRHMTHHR